MTINLKNPGPVIVNDFEECKAVAEICINSGIAFEYEPSSDGAGGHLWFNRKDEEAVIEIYKSLK